MDLLREVDTLPVCHSIFLCCFCHQQNQDHYNSDEYVSVYLADIFRQKQRVEEAEESNSQTAGVHQPELAATDFFSTPPPADGGQPQVEVNNESTITGHIDDSDSATTTPPMMPLGEEKIPTLAPMMPTATQPPQLALASRFQTLSTGLSRQISTVLSKGNVSLAGLPSGSPNNRTKTVQDSDPPPSPH